MQSCLFVCTRYLKYRAKSDSLPTNTTTTTILLDNIRLHGEVFSKQKNYNNDDNAQISKVPRRTCTKKSLTDDACCPFHMTIFLSVDGYWYLKMYQNGSDASTHFGHPKLVREEVVSLGGSHLSDQQRTLLATYSSTNLSTSVSAHLLSEISDFRWLPQQVKYCCNATETLAEALTSDLSSADLLLAYLRSRDDVTYIVLTDTLSGLLVRRGKGRPSKLQPIPENFASYSAHGKRDSLMLSDSQELLLAVGWVLDHELQLLSMFPEVFFMDVTCKTNKEGRGLFLVAGKDGNNCGFTAARIFLPSEQRWVFDWIFSTALPSLLSEEVIRKNKLCVTDGDPQMFEALRSQQAKREVWLGSHVFCEWHLLVVGWKVHVSCTVPRGDEVCQEFSDTAYSWIQSWFWLVETKEEFDKSLCDFWLWLDSFLQDNDTYSSTVSAIRNFVIQSLLPKLDYWVRYSRIDQLSFEATTNSVVEGQNSSLKRGVIQTKANNSLLQSTKALMSNSEVKFGLTKIKKAKEVVSTPLWTSNATAAQLTSFAEMLVSRNFQQSINYLVVQTSTTEWLVMHKNHLKITKKTKSPITKFKRVRVIHLINSEYLHCSCCYFQRMLLPCSHILKLSQEVMATMCHLRWHKCYMFLFQRNSEVTDTMSKIRDHECIGVPIRNTSFFESVATSNSISFPVPLYDCDVKAMQEIIQLHIKTNTDNLQHNQVGDADVNDLQSVHEATSINTEVVFSPTRILLGSKQNEKQKELNYSETLKIFNVVFNLMESKPNGINEMQHTLWSLYHDTIKESSVTPKGTIVSLPVVCNNGKTKRKRTAGVL